MSFYDIALISAGVAIAAAVALIVFVLIPLYRILAEYDEDEEREG